MNPVISAVIFARAQLSTAHKPGIFISNRSRVQRFKDSKVQGSSEPLIREF